MPLGAYFGSTKIVQGAGGLGQGPLQAYADGSVGGNAASAETPGRLFAYSDGSLGAAPLLAYADGSVGGSADNPDMPGSLFSYQDGVLGPYPSGGPYSEGPGDSQGGSPGGNGGVADQPRSLLAYQDGVLGGRGCAGLGNDEADGTPISVYQQGIFDAAARNANFGPLRSYQDGSLGVVADAAAGPALDLGDEKILMEVKSLIGLMSPEQTMTEAGMTAYPAEYYTSGIWEPGASAIWQYFVSKTAAFSGRTVSESGGNQTWPNALGVGYMIALLSTPTTDNPYGEKFVKEQVPSLFAWFSAVTAGASGNEPVTLAPYLSLADKVKGQRANAGGAMKASTMAWYGLGAAALLGVGLVMTRGKKGYTANGWRRKQYAKMRRKSKNKMRRYDR
jgi:hypothetical protein